MEINRNQYFMCGLVLLMLGMQFRYVDSFVLNKQCSEILDKQMKNANPEAQQESAGIFAASTPTLASPSKLLSVKARPVMKRLTVKPTPPINPAPIRIIRTANTVGRKDGDVCVSIPGII